MKTKATLSLYAKTILFCAMLMSSASVFAQCNFSTGYPGTTGWTINGTGYTIGPSSFNFNATPCSTYNWANFPLTCTLSDDSWCAEIDFVYTARGNFGVAHTLLSFTSETANSWNSPPGWGTTNSDVIEMYINCAANAPAGTETLHANAKDGTTWGTPTTGITIAAGNTYYLRLQRLSNTQGMVSVFSNSARTVLVGAECFAISSGVTGLDNVQHGSIPQGWVLRTLTGTLDNLVMNEIGAGINGLPSAVCAGTTTTNVCVDAICGATGYTWTVPSGTTINSGQGTKCVTITWGATSGTVTCTTSLPGGACSVVQSSPITINAIPTADAGPAVNICCGATTYIGGLGGSASGGTAPYTYSWSPSTLIVGSTTSPTAQLAPCGSWTMNQSINYTLTVTDANGCVDTDVVTATRINCRLANPDGTTGTIPDGFMLLPNPSSGNFTVTFGATITSRNIEIINLVGQTIFRQEDITSSSLQIDLSLQPKGVYFVKCTENGSTFVERIVIE
jgi:hypothetical protein